MPDPETTPDDELTEGRTGILDTIKSAVGLGADDADESTDTMVDETPVIKMSDKDMARRNYQRCAGENHARKQAQKNKRAG